MPQVVIDPNAVVLLAALSGHGRADSPGAFLHERVPCRLACTGVATGVHTDLPKLPWKP